MNTMKKCSTCGTLYAGEICPKCMAGFAQKPTDPTVPGAAEELPLQPGQAFHGLEIVELLGRGGMGVVYKARQPALDRLVALKILPRKMALDPDFQNRFIREAKALGSLNHPNIVSVYDFGAEAGLFFFAMEFIDGVNLRQVLREKKFAPEQALKIVPQLCDALEYAHAEGVVHRDIKPENIMIDRKGRVKIADFGLAKLVGADAPAMLTMTNMVMGTPHYMAPEQVENPRSVDHRADIYSMGVVFYEMLTGELPIGKFEPPSKKVQVDVRLDEVVLKSLEKDPQRRYQKASDVKDAVTRATSIGTADAYPATIVTPVPARKSSGRTTAALAAVALLAVAAAVIAIATRPSAPPAPVVPPPNLPPAADLPVDLSPLHFSPEERPQNYVYAATDKDLLRNPLPAREPLEVEALLRCLDGSGIQNIERNEVKQGYLAAWWRWTAAFVALETPVAERIERSFLALEHPLNKWTHRKGAFLVLAWAHRRDSRDIFQDLVGRLQRKLGLPARTLDVPLRNLAVQTDDVPRGWTLEEKPGADETRREVSLASADGASSIFVGAYLLGPSAADPAPELRRRLEKGASRVEVHRVGRTALALALHGPAVRDFEKVAGALRSCMGVPARSWETIVPNAGELPEGYSFDRVETDARTALQQLGIDSVRPSDVTRAWRATLRPHGTIVLFEAEDGKTRDALEEHLKKAGPAWDSSPWCCGVTGPDDEALDALENRMREKFGWDRNSPRPLQLLSARLTTQDLPAGWTLEDEKIDRRLFACTIRGPQGALPCKIQQTFDYGKIDKIREELGAKPGDVVLVKDTVIAWVGGTEEAWPVLDELEAVLRKKMRLGPATALDLAVRAVELPAGSLYLDRPPQHTPNPRTLKPPAPEVKEWWQALVDPSETRVDVYRLGSAAAAAEWAAKLKEAAPKPPARFTVHARGPLVVSLQQQKAGDAVFTALSETLRAKLRLRR